MSAGNHAQGVAYHARRLGIPATIVMPEDTPFTKIERTERYGSRVVLAGKGLAEARRAAAALASRRNLTLVHPYDDAAVIAGQGTVALELLADAPGLDAILVPLGGGGLCPCGASGWVSGEMRLACVPIGVRHKKRARLSARPFERKSSLS